MVMETKYSNDIGTPIAKVRHLRNFSLERNSEYLR